MCLSGTSHLTQAVPEGPSQAGAESLLAPSSHVLVGDLSYHGLCGTQIPVVPCGLCALCTAPRVMVPEGFV